MKQAFIFWPQVSKREEPTSRSNSAILDISKHQGAINFDALAPEVSLIIARVSCGSDKDVRIDEYAAEMKRLGIPFGVYCYSYAVTVDKARDEAQKMIQYAKDMNPLFYVLDAEEARLTHETIKAFVTELRKLTNKPIGCYVAHNHYEEYGYASLQALFDFTWIPRYGKNDGTIDSAAKPKYFCDLWQYTSTGKVNGITKYVDMNVITSDGHNLDWFIGKK